MISSADQSPVNCSCTKNVHDCVYPVCSGTLCVKYYKLNVPGRPIEAEFCTNDTKFHCVNPYTLNASNDHVYQLCCRDKDMCNKDLRLPQHITALYEKSEPVPTFNEFVANPYFVYFAAFTNIVIILAIICCIILGRQKHKLQERLAKESEISNQIQSDLADARCSAPSNASIVANYRACNIATSDSQDSGWEPLIKPSRLSDTTNSKTPAQNWPQVVVVAVPMQQTDPT